MGKRRTLKRQEERKKIIEYLVNAIAIHPLFTPPKFPLDMLTKSRLSFVETNQEDYVWKTSNQLKNEQKEN